MVAERLNSPVDAPLHLNQLSPDLAKTVEVIYLATLTRRPSLDEESRFVVALEKQPADQRKFKAVDIYWALINGAEFRWSH